MCVRACLPVACLLCCTARLDFPKNGVASRSFKMDFPADNDGPQEEFVEVLRKARDVAVAWAMAQDLRQD